MAGVDGSRGDAEHARVGALEVMALVVLVAVGAALRLPDIDLWYWGDETQTVVISDRSPFDIPDALERDGAPPAFYVLLSGWMAIFGKSETATHSLTVVLSLLTIVAAWWFARRHAGPWAGGLAAAAMAVNPYLVTYATETRNYALFALLGVVAAGLALDLLSDRGRYTHVALGVVLALTMLAHAWGLFFTVALLGVLLVEALLGRDRILVQRSVVAGVVAAVVYAPWLPTFLEQRRRTGAPWNGRYSILSTLDQMVAYIGNRPVAAVVGLMAVVGVVAAIRASRFDIDPLLVAISCAGTIALAFLASYIDPIWQARYGIVVVGAALMVVAIVMSRTTVGVAAFAVALAAMAVYSVTDVVGRPVDAKPEADVRNVAAALREEPPTYVLADQGSLTNLRFHIGDEVGERVTFVAPLGVLTDPTIYDWRDDLQRLRAADPDALADELIADAQPGDTFVVMLRRGFEGPRPDEPNEWIALYQGTLKDLADAVRGDERVAAVDERDIGSWTVFTYARR